MGTHQRPAEVEINRFYTPLGQGPTGMMGTFDFG